MPGAIQVPVSVLGRLGSRPDESENQVRRAGFFEEFEQAIQEITTPLSSEEARVLVQLFPTASCQGLDWSLLHLVETTEGWPIIDIVNLCPSIEWRDRLLKRCLDLFHRQLAGDGHERHQEVVRQIQKLADPSSVPQLRDALASGFTHSSTRHPRMA